MENVSLVNGHIDGMNTHILDSGDRTKFESGAVRDMHEGKGRCDLLPLDVVAEILCSKVLFEIHRFQCDSDTYHLITALEYFRESHGCICAADMVLEVAKHFEEGAKKYGESNWKKGIPVKFYIDSGVRHYLKWLRGDEDEPHDRAFCWNIMCAMWTCLHIPELNDYNKGGDE